MAFYIVQDQVGIFEKLLSFDILAIETYVVTLKFQNMYSMLILHRKNAQTGVTDFVILNIGTWKIHENGKDEFECTHWNFSERRDRFGPLSLQHHFWWDKRSTYEYSHSEWQIQYCLITLAMC